MPTSGFDGKIRTRVKWLNLPLVSPVVTPEWLAQHQRPPPADSQIWSATGAIAGFEQSNCLLT